MTEACSGHNGNFLGVSWYRVPGSEFTKNGQRVSGYADLGGKKIVVAEKGIDDGALVRHEMLHMLLDEGAHPRSQFLGSCSSFVRCQGVCITDAGKWPGPEKGTFVLLPPDSLDVGSIAKLLAPEADGQRWFSLEVTVRNGSARRVIALAPGDALTPPTFGFDLRAATGAGFSGGEIATDSSTLFFQPFETKRWLFEFKVDSDLGYNHIMPGTFLARTGYARHWSNDDTVAISP